MILKIELENQNFLDVDFEDRLYVVGNNQKKLWEVFRSIYYYFNKSPTLTSNVYGDNDIEISLNDSKLSEKNNTVFFIHDRESIYNQMLYKKGSLLFDVLNSLIDDTEISRIIDQINEGNLKLEIEIQNYMQKLSNNLKINIDDTNYLEMLKNSLLLSYEDDKLAYPLEFMDTDSLLDEFLNFLEFKLKDNGNPVWVVLYNLDGIVSVHNQFNFIKSLKRIMDDYDLKVIFIGNSLMNVPLDQTEVGGIVIANKEFEQLLPYDELVKSVRMRYPNELKVDSDKFVDSVKRISPFIGSDENINLSSKNLVLLKVVNEILNYETSYCLDDQILSSAEAEFLSN
ncbi:CRISPR-associated protein Csn2-St [Companilactobacillus hulinensis]|uniref:CRISPR-associated protein Csn2-St n=1 Tax=Companilactobacillus hulinensis TaxID=2486007 RepID=UPI000F7955EC|nr:CRISPR-associated protein Csn2-St [Companilactobacillus hulinensis]